MPLKLFTGNANVKLSQKIAAKMRKNLSKCTVSKFKDNETYVKIEDSVRGDSVFLIQSTSNPVNENFMQLCLMSDACKRAGASKITAVIPYFGYARADRRNNNQRESIAAKLSANLLTASGIDRVVVADIHSAQTLGYFDIPIVHVKALQLFANYFGKYDSDKLVVVSPDIGGVIRARNLAGKLNNCPIAIIDKRRSQTTPSNIEAFNIVGDVSNKIAIIHDDIVDSGNTISKAVSMVKKYGATKIIVCATHAVLSEPASTNLNNVNIDEIVFTDTIQIEPYLINLLENKLTILSMDEIFGITLNNLFANNSVNAINL
jgi:ribose-phosphate pyrophosphokinase